MNLHEKINENTFLHYVENKASHYDEDDNEVVDIYELSFGFYECHYMVYVRAKNIEKDFASIEMVGDSKLFESFKEMCEDELWDFIKNKCKQYDKWLVD